MSNQYNNDQCSGDNTQQQTESCSSCSQQNAPGNAPNYQSYNYNPSSYNGPSFANNLPQTYSSQSSQFWKGAVIGTGIALLLGNETVQKAMIKGATTLFSAAQAGVEEIKEKFEDIKAEMDQKNSAKSVK